MPNGMLDDCIKLNELLLKSPGVKEDINIYLNYNILMFTMGSEMASHTS